MKGSENENRSWLGGVAWQGSRLALVAAIAAVMLLLPLGGRALAALSITRASWNGDSQRLSVTATEELRVRTLTATYNGLRYPMSYDRERRLYRLSVANVCYAAEVAVSSSSGASATRAVTVSEGSTTGKLCTPPCPDADGDGHTAASCGGDDCDDQNGLVFPGATDTCGDGIDQDCSGADAACGGSTHSDLRYADYPASCLDCHAREASDVHQSTHYQWLGDAPDMVNGTALRQGKLTNSVNSYCINIQGNWSGCGVCHVGRGARPDDSAAGLENIDCLACHSEEYAASRTRLADGSIGIAAPTDSMVRNLHLPTRTTCLQCHAKAGGGDAVKRGDLSLATGTNADKSFDVHMNTAGSDLSCQSCHIFQDHRVIGKGSDLRATDDVTRGSEIRCASCHIGKDASAGHSSSKISRHVARVACQTCHIPTYAKVATETRRDWRRHADGTAADGGSGPGHPWTEKAANLVPVYRFWNRLSDNSLLGDDASRTYDASRGTYPTSRPLGDVGDGAAKLYPFKYKTAVQPKTDAGDLLVALDTGEYLKRSGDVALAIAKGLAGMGLPETEPYSWVTTDTFQLLNHGIAPSDQALGCSSCHGTSARMDLAGELGYALKAQETVVCVQCHDLKDDQKPFEEFHTKHVTDKGYDCSWCHIFSRPERNLRQP